MCRKFFPTLLLFLVLIALSTSADQEPFIKMFEDDGDDFAEFEDMEAEKKRELSEFEAEKNAEFQAFQDERDRDFAELLKAKWEAFSELEGLIRDPEPKPKVIPKANELPFDEVDPKGLPIEPLPPPAPLKKPDPIPGTKPKTIDPFIEPLEPSPTPTPEPAPMNSTADVHFYGLSLNIIFDPGIAVLFDNEVTNQSISNYWTAISNSDYEGLINQLKGVKNRLHLNDWGYYQLVLRLGETIHTDANSISLFTWFVMIKSGYRVKIGYGGNRTFLFAPTKGVIYQVPYCSIDGIKFYNLSFLRDQSKSGKIYTYLKDYPNSEHLLTLELQSSPRIHLEKQVKELSFLYEGVNYDIPVETNWNIIRFYKSYPQTEWPIYIAAPASPETETSLVQAFGELVRGKSETVAVNMLLRFVQTAFNYQTDQDQFGQEKYMFSEETLFSRYSDCEDRSFLFIYLIRRILGLEVVALHYPGHMATAVRFSVHVEGESVTIDGRRFVVCDPTYINSNIGMTMPRFKRVEPSVIKVRF